ncbi:hypothetical protein EK21DRAFT_111269 [Setomelanomma holmii]|uniref:Uncharacterized protein n=1 Tax=Setomelanomma holmii TaxID=210430 RepID=A0A9P4HCV7_9PLEO|nr:hypothetical protein EK21DRAFT_111269 [Setomelanomma holmii]
MSHQSIEPFPAAARTQHSADDYCHFLGLPRKLRDIIYEHALSFGNGLVTTAQDTAAITLLVKNEHIGGANTDSKSLRGGEPGANKRSAHVGVTAVTGLDHFLNSLTKPNSPFGFLNKAIVQYECMLIKVLVGLEEEMTKWKHNFFVFLGEMEVPQNLRLSLIDDDSMTEEALQEVFMNQERGGRALTDEIDHEIGIDRSIWVQDHQEKDGYLIDDIIAAAMRLFNEGI